MSHIHYEQRKLYKSLRDMLQNAPEEIHKGFNIGKDQRYNVVFGLILKENPSIIDAEDLVDQTTTLFQKYVQRKDILGNGKRRFPVTVLLNIFNLYLHAANQPLLTFNTRNYWRLEDFQQILMHNFEALLESAPKYIVGRMALKTENQIKTWRQMLHYNPHLKSQADIAREAPLLFEQRKQWAFRTRIGKMNLLRIFNVYRHAETMELMELVVEKTIPDANIQPNELHRISQLALSKSKPSLKEWLEQVVERVRQYFALAKRIRPNSIKAYAQCALDFFLFLINNENIECVAELPNPLTLTWFYDTISRMVAMSKISHHHLRKRVKRICHVLTPVWKTHLLPIQNVEQFDEQDLFCTFASVCETFNNIAINNETQCNTISTLQPTQTNFSKNRRQEERDYFTDEEINKFVHVIETRNDPRSTLWFYLFLHTGMRVSGIAKLRLKKVWNTALGMPLEYGTALEKGGKIRTFAIMRDDLLQNALLNWINFNPDLQTFPEKSYLFPCRGQNVFKPVHIQTLAAWVSALAKEANVSGPQVHPHAFRKTVCVRLHLQGNSIDRIAKFIQHADSATTMKFYINPTADDLTTNMVVPWLKRSANEITLDDVKQPRKRRRIDKSASESCTNCSTTTSQGYEQFMIDKHMPLLCQFKEQKLRREMLEGLLKQAAPDLYATYEKTALEAIKVERERTANGLKARILLDESSDEEYSESETDSSH